MRKKILAWVLVLVMLSGVMPAYAQEGIRVYFSMSRYGEIVEDKNGSLMACVPLDMSGKDEYTIDDVFLKVHEEYYIDGASGYQTSMSDWGLGVDMLWGDTSYNFGYQVNGGSVSVMGPDHKLSDGDYIDAVIYKNMYPDTEGYAVFDKYNGEAMVGEEYELTLNYVSGYDENWNSVFSPCSDAVITINGKATDFITDENGKAYITFQEAGEMVVSARKSKVSDNKTMPAITAPVAVITASENPKNAVVHNLAKKYKKADLSSLGGNLPWVIADMMVYEKLYQDSAYRLSESQKSQALEYILDNFATSTKPGDLAKGIIAIRALGYDCENIITKDYSKINMLSALKEMIENKEDAVTNIYTLPYVLIALGEACEYLISSALENKEKWQELEYGTDAMTPMVLALSPYYDSNQEVKATIDETLEIIKFQQRPDGLIDGPEGYESASTALAICAFSALGIDAEDVKNSDNSLIDGLLSSADEDYENFPNAFADEQALRGMLSWKLLEAEKRMYDFGDYPKNRINIPNLKGCAVVFDTTPKTATVAIAGADSADGKIFDLKEGEYEYTVSCAGYETASGKILVSNEDESNNILKTINVALTAIRTGGGGGGGSSSPKAEKEEIKEKEEETKENPEKEPELAKPVYREGTFADVKKTDWYYNAVVYAYENDLFSGTDKGFEPAVPMTRAMLVSVLYRLSGDDGDYDSTFSDILEDKWYYKGVCWAFSKGIVSGTDADKFSPDAEITREQLATIIYRYMSGDGTSYDLSSYSDSQSISDYAKDAVAYVSEIGIMSGKGDGNFCPAETATRAEVASMLMRFAEYVKNEAK